MQTQARALKVKPAALATQGLTLTVKCNCFGTNSKGVSVSVSQQIDSTEGCLPCVTFCKEQAPLNDVPAWTGQGCGPAN